MLLADKIKIIPRKLLTDDRGWFLKVINGYEESLPNFTGEVYVTAAEPLQAKGGHYHNIANEWFTLIEGDCLLKLVDLETDEKMEIQLNAAQPVTLYVPNKVAHVFINTSNTSKFILLAYTDYLYNPEDTILFTAF